jgi:hypothetical protein
MGYLQRARARNRPPRRAVDPDDLSAVSVLWEQGGGGPTMPLEKERAWFEQHRTELLEQHEGRWVVVHGETLVGIWDNLEQAYIEGVRATGQEEILVRQVTRIDPTFSAPALTLGILRAPLYL